MTTTSNSSSFRFFDNREKYLLFVTTCNEKQVIAERVAMDTMHLEPKQPALRIFDAGMGDASVLTRVMMNLHHRFPTVPMLVVGKEISYEDVRISLVSYVDSRAEFRYFMHLSDSGGAGAIGTSTILAAWNAAVYVAQIEDERLDEVMRDGRYLDVTAQALQKYGGLWFTDESFIVTRV